MDGVHDLGGIAGFGAVEIETDEPPFHHDWERRVFGLTTAANLTGTVRSGGAFRHSIERMDPAHYLNSSYYEHWLTGIATIVVELGLVTRAELDELAGGRFPLSRVDHGIAPAVGADDRTVPRFEIGGEVRVRAWHPAGHTRAPRYVQGKRGAVVRHDGAFSVPDVEAHSDRRRLEPTYSVRFTAEELWGEGGAPGEVVHVDVWESYLENDLTEGQ
jgi:nitrile hydratase subunit beta